MRPRISAILCCLLLLGLTPSVSSACTCFCLDTPDGPVVGANLDLITGDGLVFINRRGIAKEGYFESTTGDKASWVATYGSVTFNLAGRELAWSGMNEAGLVVSTLQLKESQCPTPDERPPLSEGYLAQHLLDTCATVEEAMAAVDRVTLPPNECLSHYLVTDATGACLSIEFLAGRRVYHAGADLPVKALANAPYADGVDHLEHGTVPAFNPGASVERVAAAAFMSERFDPDGDVAAVDHAFEVLTRVVVSPRRWWKDLFHEPYTRWHVVFDIARREVHFQTVTNHDVRRLSLGSFDLSCEAPVLMLDVNADLAGRVDESFDPYDHEINLKVFRTFCKKWGIDISQADAVVLMRFFEGFECGTTFVEAAPPDAE